ncbi:MAG: Rrf2 family transcriptional regulator, partial [Candidatus Pacebacteria bacterium]|nr:Rrf2 family transcriptional regulator [Candidatus Paceibacterota bacterium]
KEKIPISYLEKIMAKLKKAGLINVKKGAGGGYFLSLPPSKIKIGQIIKALEEKMDLVFCLGISKKKCPMQKNCETKIVWEKVQGAIISTLNSLTLFDLIKNEK